MTDESLLAQIEALERRLERRLSTSLHPITETLHRIEGKVDKTNGRVTRLEAHEIATNAAAKARSDDAREAAELVAEKAQEALREHERSRKWWATVLGLGFTAISVGTPLMGSALHHFHIL